MKSLVESYVVWGNGDILGPGKKAIDKALTEGFIVVDIIATPIPIGQSANNFGSGVAVTVYLVNEPSASGSLAHRYVQKRKE